jgi:hypothetical protein
MQNLDSEEAVSEQSGGKLGTDETNLVTHKSIVIQNQRPTNFKHPCRKTTSKITSVKNI